MIKKFIESFIIGLGVSVLFVAIALKVDIEFDALTIVLLFLCCSLTAFLTVAGGDLLKPEKKVEFTPITEYFYHDYVNGISRVEIVHVYQNGVNIECTYVDEAGNQITDLHFESAGDFTEDGCAQVYREGQFNLIDKNGEILCDEWFSGMGPLSDHKFKVMNEDGKINFVRSDGTLCWEDWKDEYSG